MQAVRESPVRLLWALIALLVAFSVPTRSQANGVVETRIRLLDGRNGRPISNMDVLVLQTSTPEGQTRLKRIATTGQDGYATISVPAEFKGMILVAAVGEPSYQECVRWDKEGQEFSVDAIRAAGIVSENTCKRKITQSPIPGVLILYLRPETWCHRMGDFSPCFWE
jgi:hypothetical protein